MLPPFARSRNEGQRVVHSLLHMFRSKQEMAELELQALQEEVELLRQVREEQERAVEDCLHLVEEQCRSCGGSLPSRLRGAPGSRGQGVDPVQLEALRTCVDAFDHFNDHASEDALKDFLLTFKVRRLQGLLSAENLHSVCLLLRFLPLPPPSNKAATCGTCCLQRLHRGTWGLTKRVGQAVLLDCPGSSENAALHRGYRCECEWMGCSRPSTESEELVDFLPPHIVRTPLRVP